MWFYGQTGHMIKRENLVINQVKRGNFNVSVRGNGRLVPDKVQWLSSSAQVAKVENLVVKPGETG